MKRSALSVLVLLTAAILLWRCGGGGYLQSGSTNVTVSVGSVASSAAVEPRAPTIPSEVASLRLTVSSTATPADMTPIVSTLAVTPGVTTYELSVTVPNGTRNFLLEAFDNTSTLRYRGDATMILAGGTASVTIQMSADVTPPSVLSVSPVSGATGVAVSTTVTVTFSEAMDATTVTGATFTVTAGGTPIPGTVGYSGATATFTPTGNLNDSTTYTATVTTGAEDLAGNAIASDYAWSFNTGTGIGITGSVTVNVAGPAGNTPIAGASVEVSDQGSPGSGTKKVTDINGFVEFNGVSPGNKQITIDAGVFKYVNTITVQGGTTTAVGTASNPIHLGNDPHSNTAHFAVVTGSFDRIENILTQMDIPEQVSYDNNHTGWVRYAQTDPLLGSPSELAKYNAVLINCGSDETGADNTSPLLTNLRNFVSNGGTLYASDWAYVFIEAGWPEYIDFFGDDNLAGSAREGVSGAITGTVQGPLQTALSKSTISITLDLDAWVMIDKTPEVAGKAVTVLISGPRPSGDGTEYPLMVQFPSGNGKVVYTSFHEEAQATQDMVDVLKLIALGGI